MADCPGRTLLTLSRAYSFPASGDDNADLTGRVWNLSFILSRHQLSLKILNYQKTSLGTKMASSFTINASAGTDVWRKPPTTDIFNGELPHIPPSPSSRHPHKN